MNRNAVSILTCLIALIAVAFTTRKQLDPPDCVSVLKFFKVTGTFTDCDLAAQNGLTFPITNNAANVDVTNLNGKPFTCTNKDSVVCAIGYDDTEVILNPIINKWMLRPGKTNLHYRCCVRKSLQ